MHVTISQLVSFQNKLKQAELGVPHSEIQVELNWQLNYQDVWKEGELGAHST